MPKNITTENSEKFKRTEDLLHLGGKKELEKTKQNGEDVYDFKEFLDRFFDGNIWTLHNYFLKDTAYPNRKAVEDRKNNPYYK